MRGKTEISSADFETGEPVTIEAKEEMGKVFGRREYYRGAEDEGITGSLTVAAR